MPFVLNYTVLGALIRVIRQEKEVTHSFQVTIQPEASREIPGKILQTLPKSQAWALEVERALCDTVCSHHAGDSQSPFGLERSR